MIFLGPAGNALGAKERTTEGSLRYLKEIGLNAQEIEFVRNVYLNEKKAKEIGELAKSLGIRLSVHAPYFINLLSEKKETVKASIQRILDSMDRAERMNATNVVVHAAYYGKLEKAEAFERMVEITKEILEKAKERGVKKVKLSYETMAKESQFADLDTLLALVKKVKSKNFTICIDFAHIFVRNRGKIDYAKIFDKIENFKEVFCHFSNVKYNVNTKKFMDVHIPINSHPPFKPLAQEILKRKIKHITLISESPILEKDSLKMKKIFEELGYKFDQSCVSSSSIRA